MSEESGRTSKESRGTSMESGGNSTESGGTSKESGGTSMESGRNSVENGGTSKESGGTSQCQGYLNLNRDGSRLCHRAKALQTAAGEGMVGPREWREVVRREGLSALWLGGQDCILCSRQACLCLVPSCSWPWAPWNCPLPTLTAHTRSFLLAP